MSSACHAVGLASSCMTHGTRSARASSSTPVYSCWRAYRPTRGGSRDSGILRLRAGITFWVSNTLGNGYGVLIGEGDVGLSYEAFNNDQFNGDVVIEPVSVKNARGVELSRHNRRGRDIVRRLRTAPVGARWGWSCVAVRGPRRPTNAYRGWHDCLSARPPDRRTSNSLG